MDKERERERESSSSSSRSSSSSNRTTMVNVGLVRVMEGETRKNMEFAMRSVGFVMNCSRYILRRRGSFTWRLIPKRGQKEVVKLDCWIICEIESH